MNIGSWCRRRRGKWHLVESVVADAAITRCGRRMEPVASRGELEVVDRLPAFLVNDQPTYCRTCSR